MKIAVVTGRDMTRSGALEHALKLVRHARSLNWSVLVAIPLDHTPPDYHDDVLATGAELINLDVEDYNTEQRRSVVFRTFRLTAWLRRQSVDAILTASPYTEWGLPVLGGAALAGVPVVHVLTLAGIIRIRPRKLKALEWARSRNQKYVAVSQFSSRCVAESFCMPLEEVVTIPNGAPAIVKPDPLAKHAARKKVSNEHNLPMDSPWIVSVAGLRSQKGHELQIMAMKHLLRAKPGIQFLWAGAGDLRHSLEKMAADYGVAEAIHFLGRRRDVADLLAASDLFLFPSLYEGLPLAVLEAMATGLPVVASDCTSLPELIESGKHGLLFRSGNPCELEDNVLWALNNPNEMVRMAEAAYDRVQTQFTEADMTGKTLNLLQSLVAGNK